MNKERVITIYANTWDELMVSIMGCYHDHCYHYYSGKVEDVPEHLQEFLSEDKNYVFICEEDEPLYENKVLVDMKHIPRKHTENNYSDFESCDLCNHNAFFKYLFKNEILHRCQIHKINDITKLKYKWGY